MNKIDLKKIRTEYKNWEQRTTTINGKKVSLSGIDLIEEGDDTEKSLLEIASKVNEIIDLLNESKLKQKL